MRVISRPNCITRFVVYQYNRNRFRFSLQKEVYVPIVSKTCSPVRRFPYNALGKQTGVRGAVSVLALGTTLAPFLLAAPDAQAQKPAGRGAAAPGVGASADALYKSALVKADGGDFASAVALLTKAAALAPTRTDILMSRGVAFMRVNNLERAIPDFAKVIAIDPKQADAYSFRAAARAGVGDIKGARKDLDTALTLRKSKDDYERRGLLAAQLGDFKNAVADLSSAYALDPAFVQALYERGVLRLNTGDADGAIADMTEIIAKQGDKPAVGAYITRARARASKGALADAIKDLDTASAIKDAPALIWSLRGTLRFASGDVAGAQTDFDTAVTRNPKDTEARFGRGLFYATRGEYDKADADYSVVIAALPNVGEGYLRRGIVRLRAGKPQEASNDFTKVIALSPGRPDAYVQRGNCRLIANVPDKAVADFDAALKLAPNYADAFLGRGTAYGAMNETAKALADFQKVTALDPKSKEGWRNLGLVQRQTGKFDAAVASLAKARDVAGGDKAFTALALFDIGLTQALAGKGAEAAQSYRAAAPLASPDQIAAARVQTEAALKASPAPSAGVKAALNQALGALG